MRPHPKTKNSHHTKHRDHHTHRPPPHIHQYIINQRRVLTLWHTLNYYHTKVCVCTTLSATSEEREDTPHTDYKMSAALALKDFLTRGAAALPSSFAGYSRLTADEWAAVGPLVLAVLVALYAPFLVAEKLLRSSSRADTVHKLLTRGRRSVEQYKADPVPREAIARALECAIHAPNHFLTEPWRVRLLNDEQAARLMELSKFDGTKKLLDNCPQLLVVSIDMSPDGKNDGMEWNVRGLEDHAAAACAIQNMMLSLASQGIGSKWMTGKMGISGEDVLGIFNDVAETEHYMGTFMMGYPKEPMEHMKVRTRKMGLSDKVFIKY